MQKCEWTKEPTIENGTPAPFLLGDCRASRAEARFEPRYGKGRDPRGLLRPSRQKPKVPVIAATLHDSSHASAIELRIVGRQYASPGENSTFSATLVAVDAVAIEWFVDGRWRVNESLSHSKTSLFRHRWASHARVGLHNVTTRVVAENGTLLESRPIWIAVTCECLCGAVICNKPS